MDTGRARETAKRTKGKKGKQKKNKEVDDKVSG